MEKLIILKYLRCLKNNNIYCFLVLSIVFNNECFCQVFNSAETGKKRIMIYIDRSIEFESDSKSFDIIGLYAGILEQLNNTTNYINRDCSFSLDTVSKVNKYDYYKAEITRFFSMNDCFDSTPMLFFANNFNSICSGEEFGMFKNGMMRDTTNYSIYSIIDFINSSLQLETETDIYRDFYLIMSNFYVKYEITNDDDKSSDFHLLIFSGNQDYWCNDRYIALLNRLKPPSGVAESHAGKFIIKFCFENVDYKCKSIDSDELFEDCKLIK